MHHGLPIIYNVWYLVPLEIYELMSQFLKCIVSSENQRLLEAISEFLNSELCPDFEEDVDPEQLSLFTRLQDIEFFSEFELGDNKLTMTWLEEPEITASKLINVFNVIEDLRMDLFEIDDYADCSDDPDTDMQGVVYANERGQLKRMPLLKAKNCLDAAFLF